jgi:hypothetical protein
VNRLRPILQDIISESQSAFIPGRMITDNALIAFECFHAIKGNTDARRDFCAYNLDLSKAYDRVDWDFLNKVLLKLEYMGAMGHVMRDFSVLQGSLQWCFVGTFFFPSRGLRQGDPLSPYLFLFVADGLSKLISKKVESQSLQELRICRGAPGISHLLFADDTLLFFRASVVQANTVREILDVYGQCTGQLINPGKCSILFNEKGQPNIQEQVK